MLFSGQKGIGKSTFAYHLINFLLSDGEKDKYSDDKFEETRKERTVKQNFASSISIFDSFTALPGTGKSANPSFL